MNTKTLPKLVINLGDVVEDESPEFDQRRYQEFVEILGGLDCKVLHVAGNHDTVNLEPADLLKLWNREAELHYQVTLDGVRFIVLHSQEQTDGSVALPEMQLSWLEQALFASSEPVVLLVHHPLSDLSLRNSYWFSERPHLCRVKNRKAVRRVIEQSNKVRAVFSGHAHLNACDVINSVPYITLQSLIENVEADAPGIPAAAHALVSLTDKRLLVEVAGAAPAQYQFGT
jgi:predicted phosphodiesterase